MRSLLILPLAALAISGCSLAPKMETPKTETPAAFKEAGDKALGKWKAAKPLGEKDRGAWWTVFGDKTLNALQAEAKANSPSLKTAAARVAEARGLAGAGRADLLPNISLGGNGLRARGSDQLAGGNADPSTLYTAKGFASWEPDFFGRIRDGAKALGETAEARQAAYNDALLSLQADVASLYYTLRALDAERLLLRSAVSVRAEGERIMNLRLKLGEARPDEAARATADLQSVKAELTGLDRRRSEAENALAVLLGRLPSSYTFPESPLAGTPPRVPPGLPADLLARRPDVSAAWHAMAAANARIGAARAAFLPDLTLTASDGFESSAIEKLFRWSANSWALGQAGALALSLPVFDNGRRSGALDAARGAYDAAVGEYKGKVLNAFRDVEDALAAQRYLAAQIRQQEAAESAASRATNLARTRYKAGEADYFEVVESDRSSLAASRAAVRTRGDRFVAAVELIRALGGAW